MSVPTQFFELWVLLRLKGTQCILHATWVMAAVCFLFPVCVWEGKAKVRKDDGCLLAED